ncbi:uncharacterized protein UDID_18725 [Ustilago sp. UG-2017a]|nr:uncharacterized protein UDID_18725 [Ustilago sp. UG-2017a]
MATIMYLICASCLSGSCEMQGKAIQVESESRVHAKRKQARKSSGCRSRENQFHSACASQEEQQQQRRRRRRRQQEQRLAFFSVAVCCACVRACVLLSNVKSTLGQAVKWGNAKTREVLEARQGGYRPAVTGAGRAQKRAAREGVQGGQITTNQAANSTPGFGEDDVVESGAEKGNIESSPVAHAFLTIT